MALGENLQYIRGRFGLTQEQLAERLEVSRQSVSKWESGASYPETDKIMQICDMFNVSMDDLLRGDVRREFASDNASYDRHMNSFSRSISLGVGLVLFGLALMAFGDAARISETLYTIVFFLLVIAAVLIFIISGIRHGEFCKKNPYLANFYSEAEIEKYNRVFPFYIAIPVGVILAGVVLMIASEELPAPWIFNEDFYAGVFMLLLSLSVPFIVYGGMQKSKYDIESYNKGNYYDSDYSRPDAVPEDKRAEYDKNAGSEGLAGRICGVIMLLATAAFLAMGLGWHLWHICWVVFPVGGVLCGAVNIALAAKH